MQARSLARAAVLVGIAYVLSNLTGLGQRIIVTSRFGTSVEYDAFNAAFRIPDLLFSLLAGGALASAFIPTFTARLSLAQQALAWRLAAVIAILVFIIMTAVAAAAALLAPFLVRTIIAPGFHDESEVALTVALMRVMLISTVIFGVSGLLMGVLQSNNSFLAPAIAPSLYNIGIIFGAVVLSGQGIYGVALGVVLGSALHLVIQVPALLRILSGRGSAPGRSVFSSRELRDDVRNVVRLMLPRIVGLGAVQVNLIVTVALASGMGEGAVSALNIAFATLILPQAAIAQATATVLFPTISAHAARGEHDEFGAALTRAINVVIALSAPASIGLIMLGQPIIRLLFQRGTFGPQSTAAVAFALMWYGVGLVGHSALEVVTRGFYALHDTLSPVVLSVASMVMNVALSLILAGVFSSQHLPPYGGLALANSVATALETLILFALLARRVPELDMQQSLVASLKSALASGVMAAALWAWLSLAGSGNVAALVAIPAGVAVYFGTAWVLRSDEALFAARIVRTRLARHMPLS